MVSYFLNYKGLIGFLFDKNNKINYNIEKKKISKKEKKMVKIQDRVFRSYTDSRAVFDVVAPGYSDFSVKVAFTDGGDTAKIIVRGKHKFSKDPDDATTDSHLAYESVINEDLKVLISSDDFIRLNSGDFDFDGLRWKAENGIVRIVIPKTKLARGTAVEETKGDVNAPIVDEDDKKKA